jgi:hypothetical protein
MFFARGINFGSSNAIREIGEVEKSFEGPFYYIHGYKLRIVISYSTPESDFVDYRKQHAPLTRLNPPDAT